MWQQDGTTKRATDLDARVERIAERKLQNWPSCSLTHRTNNKLMFLSAYWQWKLANELARIAVVYIINCTEQATGGPSSQREELYCFFFLLFCERSAKRDQWHGIYHYTTIEFDFAKRDSRLAAYGGVVLQRFEFIKVCMGTQRFCWKTHFSLYFVNKIYLPCCCVVFFSVCQFLRPI